MLFPFCGINGRIVRQKDARIPLTDLGLLRSYSVFEFFKVIRSKPLFVEAHLDRLMRSITRMELNFRWNKEEVIEMYRGLIEQNRAISAGVRTVATGGYADDGYTPSEANIYIMLHTLPEYADTLYSLGARLISVNYQRDVPDVKTTIYTQTVLQRKSMNRADAIELLYAWNGEVSECSRSNIFFVRKDKTLITPDTGILSGITRRHVLELAARHYRIERRIVMTDELPQMQEAFITSTTKGIMPVVKIDDVIIGSGSRGQVTADLMERFKRHVEEYVNNSKF